MNRKYTEFEKGYNTALEKTIKYLYDNLMYVPEDDNPHVESCKITNLEEFVNDFIKHIKIS